jgi:formylglycine-generating enzyme required for sulfatase activity
MKVTSIFLLALALLCSFTGPGDSSVAIKTVENNLVKVGPGLYANKYETTNKEYRTFLEEMKLTSGDTWKNYEIRDENWKQLCAEKDSCMDLAQYALHYSNYRGFENFPVVNITYDDASLFCQWLTKRYNSDPKRKFSNVIAVITGFRKPMLRLTFTTRQI